MRIKNIAIIGTLCFLSSTAFIYADTVKTIKDNEISYISLQEISQKLGLNLKKEDGKYTLSTIRGNIEVAIDNSFIKLGQKYIPTSTIEIDGYVVPNSRQVITKGDMTYIPLEFFKNNKVGDYTIKGNTLTTDKQKDEVDLDNETTSDNDTSNESSDTNNTNRPNNNNSGNGSNSNSSGNGNNSSNTGNKGDSNESGNKGDSDNSGNESNPEDSGNKDDSGDSGNKGDSEDSGNENNSGDSENESNSGDSGNKGDSGDSGNKGDSEESRSESELAGEILN